MANQPSSWVCSTSAGVPGPAAHVCCGFGLAGWGMHMLTYVLLLKSNRPTGSKVMVHSKMLAQQDKGGMCGRRRKWRDGIKTRSLI